MPSRKPRTRLRQCKCALEAPKIVTRFVTQPAGCQRPSSSVPSESRRLAAHESAAGRTASQLGSLGFVLLRSAAVLP